MSADTVPDQELADLYAFCSAVIADPPDEDAIARLIEDLPNPAIDSDAIDNGYQLLEQWRDECSAAEAEYTELRRAHTSLFVGPRPELQVYESWYADDYLGEPLAAVRQAYQTLSIQPAEVREEPDHLAIELAALELLIREGDSTERKQFLDAHGWWIPEAGADIVEKAETPFYQAVGWLVFGAIEADLAAHGLNIAELEPGYDIRATNGMATTQSAQANQE